MAPYMPCIVEWYNVTETANNASNGTRYDIIVPGVPEPSPYSNIAHLLSSRIAVVICAFGILGNILTLVLLLRRRKKLADRRGHRNSESRGAKSDIWCFVALSISDLLFCACLLSQWQAGASMTLHRGFSYMLVYERLEDPILNTFVMSSTWLTVSMTVNRYIHLSHPIWAMKHLGRHCLIVAIGVSVLFSVLFNLPRYWFTTIDHLSCYTPDLTAKYYLYWVAGTYKQWETAYRWSYFIVGIILPLCSLSYSNARIILAVCRSMAVEQRRHQERNVITRTLIFVVFFYVCLVSPAELLKFFEGPLSGYYSSPGTYGLVLAIANVLQAVNFSANFLPYLVLDKSIRRGILQAGCQKRLRNGAATSQTGRPHDGTYDGITSSHDVRRHIIARDSLLSMTRDSKTEMTNIPNSCRTNRTGSRANSKGSIYSR